MNNPARVALSIEAPDLIARTHDALAGDPLLTVRRDPAEPFDLIIADRDPRSGRVIAIVPGAESAAEWRADLRAVLPPDAPNAVIRAAVHAVAVDLAVVPAAFLRCRQATPNTQVPKTNELTPREKQVLELLVTGEPNKRIARRLGISVPTVKFHVAAILSKLGAKGRAEAIAIAFRRGLVML